MSENRYIGSTSSEDAERERLRHLRTLADPITQSRIQSLGLASGASCLEVGAGDGSVAVWLAKQIGPKGHVAATDIRPGVFDGVPPDNVEIWQHDIIEDKLDQGVFDFVHCRAVLMHLKEPEVALQKMTAALRPGGWLLVEELDHTSLGAAGPSHPSSEIFNHVIDTGVQVLKSAGIMDPFFGRRLPGLFAELALEDVGHDGRTWVNAPGTVGTRLWRLNLAIAREPVIRSGALSGEEYDRATEVLDDPSFYLADLTVFGAWGRRAS